MDKDLESIQQVRDLVAAAKRAQKELAACGQQQLDSWCRAVRDACVRQAEPLAKMAAEETGYGIWQDKVLKNLLGSATTWKSIESLRVVGRLGEDRQRGLVEIGVPMGVVAALIPSTNPTSTVMYKALISLKAGNAIVVSPHPGAKNCIIETARVISQALEAAGAPKGAMGCLGLVTPQAVDALLKHRDVSIILATGGEAMVRAAYSSGNPAIGVGPGNGPAFIERTADIPAAVKMIVDSKTFDNGTICASEQSVVTEAPIAEAVLEAFRAQGGHLMGEAEAEKVARLLLAGGRMNPRVVGKSAAAIAEMAGIAVPAGTRVLISRQTQVAGDNPYAREKLCPVLGFYVEADWQAACARCIEILANEGAGHTMSIHSKNEDVIEQFAMKKAVSRLLVNTPAALGGVGATTNLPPALTLGCGAVGKSATSDNITPMNLINIRRVAAGCRQLEDLRADAARVLAEAGVQSQGAQGQSPQSGDVTGTAQSRGARAPSGAPPETAQNEAARPAALTAADVAAITELVVARLAQMGG